MMNISEIWQKNTAEIYREWYGGIDINDEREGWGALCGGVTILENLMDNYTLNLRQHQTRSGTQLRKAGATLGNRVLQRFGIIIDARLGEFGRTSRGAPPAAEKLMELLGPLQLDELSPNERNEILLALQRLIVNDLLKRLVRRTQLIRTNSTDTFEKTLSDLFAAVPSISSDAVAQHLVGAKLQLRYPDREISNDVTAAADAPTNRPGDFIIKDTSIHITLAPQDAVFQKCIENLNEGLNVYLLVTENKINLARRKAVQFSIAHQITIKSIESFIAQNIDEMAGFSKENHFIQKDKLIQIYNQRIQKANERYAPYLSLDKGGIEMEVQLDEPGSIRGDISNVSPGYPTPISLFDLVSDSE